jgi:hypothetical protein
MGAVRVKFYLWTCEGCGDTAVRAQEDGDDLIPPIGWDYFGNLLLCHECGVRDDAKQTD